MKNIYYIITILALFALASSCDLSLFPEDKLSPEVYFKKETDLALWTNGYYTILDAANGTAATNADDNIDNGMGEAISGTRSAASETGWNWDKLRDINYQLGKMHQCDNTEIRQHYKGVAHFFRAYFYFVKVRRYGDVPWYDNVIGSEDYANLKKPRDDRGMVMDNLLADLDIALDSLRTKQDLTKVSRWTALALKSRAALYEGTFRKYHGLADAEKYLNIAAEAAQEFITSSGYTLFNEGAEPYRDLFCSDLAKSQEVILTRMYNFAELNVSHSVQFNIANNLQGFTRRFMNHYLMSDGSRFTDQPNHATTEYVDEVKNRDPRLAQTVLCPGYMQKGDDFVSANTLMAMTGYQPIKFVTTRASDGSLKSSTDWTLFRAAEVYLDFAEAKAELGIIGQADLDISINVIRDRANMPHLTLATANASPDPYLSGCYPNVMTGANTGVILEIRRERTIELTMEGNRFWDMLRWKEGAQMVNENVPYLGCYFPGEGLYDMDGDGNPDLELYTTTPVGGNAIKTKKKIGADITLSNGASGHIKAWPEVTFSWQENRDYLYPVPAEQRVSTGGILTQNPNWDDGLSFD